MELVNDVVAELIKRDFFDNYMFKTYGILTSFGIQKRFIKICSDAKRKGPHVDPKHDLFSLLPEERPILPEERPILPEESAIILGKSTQRKKVNKSTTKKEIYDGADAPSTPSSSSKKSIQEREKDFYDALVPFVPSYGADMIRSFFDYWSEKNKTQTMMNFEYKKTFEISKRLATWKRNQNSSNPKANFTQQAPSPNIVPIKDLTNE